MVMSYGNTGSKKSKGRRHGCGTVVSTVMHTMYYDGAGGKVRFRETAEPKRQLCGGVPARRALRRGGDRREPAARRAMLGRGENDNYFPDTLTSEKRQSGEPNFDVAPKSTVSERPSNFLIRE